MAIDVAGIVSPADLGGREAACRYYVTGNPQDVVRPGSRVGSAGPPIANSDAAWDAYAHAAIDEAARAVAELW